MNYSTYCPCTSQCIACGSHRVMHQHDPVSKRIDETETMTLCDNCAAFVDRVEMVKKVNPNITCKECSNEFKYFCPGGCYDVICDEHMLTVFIGKHKLHCCHECANYIP